MPEWDVAICGVGAMGSAALYHLARRGLRVIGIERVAPGHPRGSSHGLTRMIRLSYFEHPSYVPLVRRAYACWRDLEQAAGRSLLHRTGILEIGPAGGRLVQSTLAAARLHNLAHEVLDGRDLMRRYPAFRVPGNFIAVRQPDGGTIAAAAALAAMVALARESGARLLCGRSVGAIEPRRGGVRIRTDRGSIKARKAIVTAGAWTGRLVPELALPLRPTRQVLSWMMPRDREPFIAGRTPVFLLESRYGIHYGIPFAGEASVKLAKHHHADRTVDPDTLDDSVGFDDIALIRRAIAEFVPAADGRLVATKTCLYTMTPDGDFILDHHPDCADILIASPCSGHGFKFAAVIGEVLADLVVQGTSAHDLSRFGIGRFRVAAEGCHGAAAAQ
jgi:sarcosine oxidase